MGADGDGRLLRGVGCGDRGKEPSAVRELMRVTMTINEVAVTKKVLEAIHSFAIGCLSF